MTSTGSRPTLPMLNLQQVRYSQMNDPLVAQYMAGMENSTEWQSAQSYTAAAGAATAGGMAGVNNFSHRSPRLAVAQQVAYSQEQVYMAGIQVPTRIPPQVPTLNLPLSSKGVADGSSSERRLSTSMTPGRAFTPMSSRAAAHSSPQYDTRSDQSASATTWEGGAITAAQALKRYATYLTEYEKDEISDYANVYFVGRHLVQKVHASSENTKANLGYDDERGDYVCKLHDHIAYRYEILGSLGKGSFGQVLKVHDFKLNQTKALKIIRNKRRFHTQALVEVKVLQHLRDNDPDDSHNVIHMHESFYFRHHLCITFDLLSVNLYDFIKQHNFQALQPRLIRRFAFQILNALKYMKGQNIIHCDLKPENILLQAPNKATIKVIDFGSSCFLHQRMYTYIQSRFYRSPEVILALPYGTEIDMWSFGCILAELAAGYPLFPGEGEHEQLLCIMEVFGPPPRELLARAKRTKYFFDNRLMPKIVPSKKGVIRQPGSKTLRQLLNCSDPLFFDLLEGCLRWDPAQRLTPEQALQHPYIAEQMLSPSHRLTPRMFADEHTQLGAMGVLSTSNTPRRNQQQIDPQAMQNSSSQTWQRGQSQLSSQSAALQAQLNLMHQQQQQQQQQQQPLRSHSQLHGATFGAPQHGNGYEQMGGQGPNVESPMEHEAYLQYGRNSSSFSTARNFPISPHSTPRSFGTPVDMTGTSHMMLHRNLGSSGAGAVGGAVGMRQYQAAEGTPRSVDNVMTSSQYRTQLELNASGGVTQQGGSGGAARQMDYRGHRTLPQLGRYPAG